MASFCRLAIAAGSRSLAARSKTTSQSTLSAKSIFSSFSSSAGPLPRASRLIYFHKISLIKYAHALNLIIIFIWIKLFFIIIIKGLFRLWEVLSHWCRFTAPLPLLGLSRASLLIQLAGAGFLRVTFLISICLSWKFFFSNYPFVISYRFLGHE